MSASGSGDANERLLDENEGLVVGGCNQFLRACVGNLWSLVRRARRAPASEVLHDSSVENTSQRSPEEIEQGPKSNFDSSPEESEDKVKPNRNAMNPTILVPITASIFAIMLQLEILSRTKSVSPYVENKLLIKSSLVALILMVLSSVLVGYTKGKLRTGFSIGTYILSTLATVGPLYVVLSN